LNLIVMSEKMVAADEPEGRQKQKKRSCDVREAFQHPTPRLTAKPIFAVTIRGSKNSARAQNKPRHIRSKNQVQWIGFYPIYPPEMDKIRSNLQRAAILSECG
jgi:hypothetical protein